jgi:hypothetical protein
VLNFTTIFKICISSNRNPAQGIEENKMKFYDIGNFPNIFGLIDGTHVRIIAPSQHEDQFVNRKGYYSFNVQVVLNAD